MYKSDNYNKFNHAPKHARENKQTGNETARTKNALKIQNIDKNSV